MKIYERSMQTSGLDMIAHDLRTPMTSVSGAAQIALYNSRRGMDVDRQLHQILAAIETMDRLLSHVCKGAARSCSADALETTIRMLMEPRAAQKKQMLCVDLAMLGDACFPYAEETERVMINLVSNAVKYTQEGGEICVLGRLSGSSAVITVADNGMGMKRSFMLRMFEPFQRAQESRNEEGKGLGLCIVRNLVRSMGGGIRVRSVWGKGTAVTVRVPVKLMKERMN